jgi:calcium-dependent protein kinase
MDLFENPIKYKAGSLLQDIRKIYKFRDNLGGGHFGKVRLGYRRNEKPPPFYAIKSISKRNLTDKDLEDLIKEVDIISCLDHPNIIKFYETYHDKFYFHIVMELCKGKEVFDRIVEDGRIKEKKVCMVIMKVLHAISYCHSRGVTHRDLKPENILFETLDSESEIKLIDFGLSRKVFNDEKMHTILGTPYYVAPEVLQGEYDEKCDIWSIGALTYIMLCGDPPFKGNSNHEIFNKILREDVKFSSKKWEKISDDAKNFVKNCLIKIPDKRPNAIQCLNNLWFKDILNDVHSVNNISVDILNNLKNFSIKEKFTKMVIKYLLNTLTEKEKNIYKKAFYAMDYKHKGTIDIEDLEKSFQIGKVLIKKEELEKLIKLVDENGKNSLDYTELLIAGINKQKLFNEEKLKMAFQYFDVNNSGIIEISDLKDAMLRFGKKIIYSDDVNKLIQEVTKNMSKDCLNWEDFINIFKEIQNEE